MNRDFVEVLEQFGSTYSDCVAAPIGKGNINDTFIVASSAGKFILQRISATVFPEPLHVISNFRKISEHLGQKTAVTGVEWQFARPVYTDRGKLFYRDRNGDFWRGQTYLPHNGVTLIGNSDQACELGRALGFFHVLMSDMSCENLHDPLPGFHVLPSYLEKFDLAWRKKQCSGQQAWFCLEVIDRYRSKSDLLERAKREGILTEQPIHGDPKIDNFIFNDAGYGVGLIDLDTVGPGLIHSDIGDCLRSCCNRSGEEGGSKEHDISFDMGVCRAILDGYFQSTETLLTSIQRGYIFDALLLITFELGLRFFTDHLQGNSYFKIKMPGDNLQRAVTQFRLVGEIEKCGQEIREITSR